MVRATRSSAALQSQHGTVEHSQLPAKKHNKKRKRTPTTADLEDRPASKQRRSDSKRVDEGPGIGDLPLSSQDASKILDILEIIDTQGLLDRVFPLPDSDASFASKASTSKDVIKTYSLRALLKDSAMHPLRVLRMAIQPLFPISSHPRSRPSIPAAQQLHFCNLALSLLDQASSQSHPALSLSQSSLFAHSDVEPSTSGASDKRRRYALVQRLPSGEWWSSSNTAREGEQGLTAAEAKEMRKGQAELVSIIPSLPLSHSSMSTLGELQMEGRKEPRNRFKPLHMHPRALSSGTFLDYGAYTSFAPAFDSEGAEVGRDGLGQVLLGRIERREVREARRKLIARIQAAEAEDVCMTDASEIEAPQEQDWEAIEDILESLFPEEKLDGFKAALQTLRVEEGASSLLEKNARALERLNLLQTVRLRSGNNSVKEGSEEWNLAREITNSLALLASLRPRVSSSDLHTTGQSPIIPPPSVLRALHGTLPAGGTHGWQGTLDETRKTALRDDTTVHVKAGAPQVSAQPAAVASQPYGAPGQYAQNQYRSQVTYPYHNVQAQRTPVQNQSQNQNSYYPNAYLQSQPSGTPAQYQYTYPPASWYNYQASTQAGQKPGTTAPFYGNYMAQTGTPRAVGNTAKPQQAQQNGWAQGYGQNQTVATLPPHLRRAGTSTPGTQTPTQSYASYQAYVPAAQAQNG